MHNCALFGPREFAIGVSDARSWRALGNRRERHKEVSERSQANWRQGLPDVRRRIEEEDYIQSSDFYLLYFRCLSSGGWSPHNLTCIPMLCSLPSELGDERLEVVFKWDAERDLDPKVIEILKKDIAEKKRRASEGDMKRTFYPVINGRGLNIGKGNWCDFCHVGRHPRHLHLSHRTSRFPPRTFFPPLQRRGDLGSGSRSRRCRKVHLPPEVCSCGLSSPGRDSLQHVVGGFLHLWQPGHLQV